MTGGAGGRGGSDGQLYAGRPGFHPGLATVALALSMPQSPRQQRATCVSSGIGANRPRGQCESILSGEEETRVSVGGDGGSESLRGCRCYREGDSSAERPEAVLVLASVSALAMGRLTAVKFAPVSLAPADGHQGTGAAAITADQDGRPWMLINYLCWGWLIVR